MCASAWFSAGAGTACTKHLFRLSRREAAVPARSAGVLETILCPHAVPFTESTRWSGNRGQLYAGSGEGQSSHSRSFVDPDVSGAGAGVQSQRCAAGLFAMERDRAQRRMGVPVMKNLDGLALVARVGRLAHPLPSLNCCEPFRVERLAPKQHVIDRTAQLGRENAQGFSLPVLLLKPGEVLLSGRVATQEQCGGFREGPFQMDVAHLASRRLFDLASRLVGSLDQAGIGQEVLDAGEALNVVNLIEQGQGEDLPNP